MANFYDIAMDIADGGDPGCDHVMDTDNNYKQVTDARGKLLRCLFAQRGRWPGGRGEVFGSANWERIPAKNTEAERANTITDFTEALQPLVNLGLIRDVEVTLVDYDTHRTNYQISAYDTAKKGTVTLVISAPWGP